MPLYEHMPYTNFENLNLDWILKTIKTHQTDIDGLKTDVNGIKTTIINIQGDITTIQGQIGDIDVTSLRNRLDALEADARGLHTSLNALTGRVTTTENNVATNTSDIAENTSEIAANDTSSRQRDDALSARIRNLEQATIHDIYNYFSESNQLLFGSDLRHMAPVLDADGYPIVAWGNKTNASQAGTPETRSFKFVEGGMIADTSRASYDYYQVGQFTNGLGINGAYTVTLALVNADDATPTWYKHTFTASNEAWTIAPNCIIRIRKFYNWNDESTNHIVTVAFMGTAANWNAFLGNSKISFIFIENGTGSVDTSVTAKPPYNMKDREFFGHDATPTLPETIIEGDATATATVTYYDQVGEPQTLEAGVTLHVSATKYGRVVDGYLQMVINLANNLGDKLASGAQFTLANVAMTYQSANALPMPNGSSTLLGVATDSRSLAWDYVNTQNAYIWFNIDTGAAAIGNRGTFNVKLISSGMRNYTSGSATGNTMMKIPFHYVSAT